MILPESQSSSRLVVLPWFLVGLVWLNIIFALAGVLGVGASGPILVVANCGPLISLLSLFGPCPGPPSVPGLCPPVPPIRLPVSPASFRVRLAVPALVPGTILCGAAPTAPVLCLVPLLPGLHVWDGLLMLMARLRSLWFGHGSVNANLKFGGRATLLSDLLRIAIHQTFLLECHST